MKNEDASSTKHHDPFPSMNSERTELLIDAVRQMKQQVTEAIHRQGNVYWNMPKRQQANMRRAIYLGVLNTVFKDKDGVVIREDNGGFYLVFDETSVGHLKKLDPKTHLSWTPKALEQSQKVEQLTLGKEFIDDQPIPLNQLHPFVVGIVEDQLGGLAECYLVVQLNGEILHKLPLDLVQVIPFEEPAFDAPKFKISAKKDTTTG